MRRMLVALVLVAGCGDEGGGAGAADGGGDVGSVDVGGTPVDTAETPDVAADVPVAGEDVATECAGEPDGTPCDDGNACTEGTTCQAGGCGGGATVACDSGPCQVASCDPKVGCQVDPAPDGTACAVGCFGAAACKAGACVPDPATQVKCPPPSEPCVSELACDPGTGQCDVPILKSAGVDCDTDDDVCTKEVCNEEGWCGLTGAVETCASQAQNNPCWTWQCNKKSGCQQVAFVEGASCDDGNGCTGADTCTTNEIGQKLCVGTPLVVADGNPCTDDKCTGGVVTHTPLSGTACEATGACSVGICEGGACTQTPVADGTVCGLGKVCSGGQCADVACTPACGECEACDAGSGTCKPKANGLPCGDDGNPCTTDACGGGVCLHGPITDGTACTLADDGDPCTTPKCGGGQCSQMELPDGTSCGAGMICQDGACMATSCSPPCGECQVCSGQACQPINGGCTDDGNPCTLDTCSGGACTHPAVGDGVACPGGTCLGGSCKPSSTPVTLADGLDSPWAIAVDQTHVWFVENDSTAGTVSRVAKTGGAVETFASNLTEPCAITTNATDVFWLERAGGSGGVLGRVSKGGGPPVPLATGLKNAQNHLALDSTHVYFGDGKAGGGGAVRRVPIGGGPVETLVDTGIVNLTTAIDVDSAWVYFQNDSGQIKRVPKAGGTVETVGAGSPSSLKIVGTTLYFVEYTEGAVKKLPLGGSPSTLTGNAYAAGELAVDGTHVYWIEFDSNGKVARVPLGGGSVETISNQANTIGVGLDTEYVYWSVSKFINQGKIMRVGK